VIPRSLLRGEFIGRRNSRSCSVSETHQDKNALWKYKGRLLIDLPKPYVIWFASKGFPEGELGQMLNILYEVKSNGLEYLFKPLR
jgi:uncharacterized protein (DUF3820 family)